MGNNTSSSSNPSVEMVKMNGNDNVLLTQRKRYLEKRIEESKDALNAFGENIRHHAKVVVEKELADLEKELKKINEQLLSANGGGGKRKSKRTKSKRSKKSNKSNKSKRMKK
jgi:hypothetical protein